MAYRGLVDFASDTEIRGWVCDKAFPDKPLTVEIVSAGAVIASVLADEARQDGPGAHAFGYKLEGDRAAASARGRQALVHRAGGFEGVVRQLQRPGPFAGVRVARRPTRLEQSRAFGGRAPNRSPARRRLSPRGSGRLASSRAQGRRLVGIAIHCHGEIDRLLRERDVEAVAAYLRDAHARGITQGITQGDRATASILGSPEIRRNVAGLYMDTLASLAECVGVLDVESPEQPGPWAENIHSDAQALVDGIEAAIGIPVVPPSVIGSLFGLQTRDGVLSARDLLALYAALRLRAVCRDSGIDGPAVCEIGAGLGGVAYYSNRLGITRYTVIDLPLINVVQGYFLLRALPETEICLYGEPEPPSSGAFLRVLPTWCLERPGPGHDVLFNQDSLPELHIDYALGYLRNARRNGCRLFLSINQEARAPQTASTRQTVVRELAREVGGYERLYRFRHWLRVGYAEELYKVAPEPPAPTRA